MKYRKVVVGIDQSYKDTGISVSCDGKVRRISHVKLSECSDNSSRRSKLRKELEKVFRKCCSVSDNVVVICERIRLKSQGFISIDYIKSMGALNAVIVDTAKEFGLEVFSVDTRSWKAQVVGTSKPKKNKYGIAPEKYPTILHVQKLGMFENILEPAGKRKKGVIEVNGEKFFVNDNAADSACISLYGFISSKEQKLEVEK